jgi:TonB family protein
MPLLLLTALWLLPFQQNEAPPDESSQLLNVSMWDGTFELTNGVPTYPAEAVTAKLEGTVEAELVVSTTGRLLHGRLSKSAGDILDKATAQVVARWRFAPFKNANGAVIPVLLLARVEYRIGTAGPTVAARLLRVPDTPPSLVGDGLPGEPVSPRGIVPSAPTPLRVVKAAYSESARRAKVVGDVQLEIVILADGTVGRSRVVKSLDTSLDHQARIAAGYWLFKPAVLNGEPVVVRATVLVPFSLQ